jgi:hypothetical protein
MTLLLGRLDLALKEFPELRDPSASHNGNGKDAPRDSDFA